MATFNVITPTAEYEAAYADLLQDPDGVTQILDQALASGIVIALRAEFMGVGATGQFYSNAVHWRDRHIHEVLGASTTLALTAVAAALVTVSRDGPWSVQIYSYDE